MYGMPIEQCHRNGGKEILQVQAGILSRCMGEDYRQLHR